MSKGDMHGIRIEQVEPGTVIGDQTVTDSNGVQDAKRGTIYVTARHYEAIKAVARESGQVPYAHRSHVC